MALKGRFGKLGAEGRVAVQEISHYQQMIVGFRDAIQNTIELKRQG